MQEAIPLEEKKKKVQKLWDAEHKPDYNQTRKEKYQSDPEYRARMQKQARDNKRKRHAQLHGSVVRYWHGNKVLVHRVGSICEHLGISAYTIRALEEDGILPKPIFQGKQRVYTQNQFDLIQLYFIRLAEVAHDPKATEAYRQRMKIKLKARWEDL